MATSANTHPSLSYTDGLAATWSDFLLLVGRVFLGWLLLASGYGKFGSIAGITAYFTSLGMSPPELWAWFAAISEIVLGAALILGIATRYAALPGRRNSDIHKCGVVRNTSHLEWSRGRGTCKAIRVSRAELCGGN
jgi:hypothetical protein